MNNNTKRLITLAVMLASSPLYAAAMSEVEQNQTIGTAQYVQSNDKEIDVNAALGTVGATVTITTSRGTYVRPAPTDDLDMFSFYAQAGDVVTLDINHGYGGQQSVDTVMAVFDSNGKMLRENDDASSVDAGSTSTLDSRIDNFKVPASGVYTVGVSSYPRLFNDGGTVSTSSGGAGDYELAIRGVSPAVHQINIEVKPGSQDRAPINPKSNGKIPVALLSDSQFNALDIDPASVTFGSSGNEASLSKCLPSKDVNNDGLPDLICLFDNQKGNFSKDSIEGVARGKTSKGVAFEGRGPLKVLPSLTK